MSAQTPTVDSRGHLSTPSVRKAPSRQTLNPRISTASLRAPSIGSAGSATLANSSMSSSAAITPDHGQHSLAHELAVALMPEPSSGSRLLAEEFGIEYDEGAEGIDQDSERPEGELLSDSGFDASSFGGGPPEDIEPQFAGQDPVFGEPATSDPQFSGATFGEEIGAGRKKPASQDAMEVLAQDLEYTDNFLSHLRHIDSDTASTSTSHTHPNRLGLERMAQDVIRRIDESTRDREGQVRELLGYEREFRKIAGEIGGSDALAQLEELSPIEEETGHQPDTEPTASQSHTRRPSVQEDPNDWEVDPDRLGDDDEEEEHYDEVAAATPVRDTFPPPPPINGPTTPAVSIAQLAHLRTFTTSLVSSLTTISEQAQVNGAATTEAGRKIRALKNKMSGWQTDWDSAEISMQKIEKWEAGNKRVDGRSVVEEHLKAFELALADAATKTKAIMATS